MEVLFLTSPLLRARVRASLIDPFLLRGSSDGGKRRSALLFPPEIAARVLEWLEWLVWVGSLSGWCGVVCFCSVYFGDLCGTF